MNFKAAIAIFAGMVAGLLGQRYATGIRAESQRLHRWLSLLDRLQLLIRQAALPLPDALSQAADGSSVPDQLLQTLAAALRNNPLLSLADCYVSAAVSLPENEVLRTLMMQLDRGTAELRLLAISQAQASLQQLADSAAERADRDAALWTRLGWTGGACLTILLI